MKKDNYNEDTGMYDDPEPDTGTVNDAGSGLYTPPPTPPIDNTPYETGDPVGYRQEAQDAQAAAAAAAAAGNDGSAQRTTDPVPGNPRDVPPGGPTPPGGTVTPPPPVAPPAAPANSPSYTASIPLPTTTIAVDDTKNPPPTAAATTNPFTAAATTTPPVNPNQGFDDSIRQALLALIGQPNVSAEDPELKPALLAHRVAGERSLADERNAIAERWNALHMQGSGASEAEMNAAQERTGESNATFAGNALMNAAQQRRAQITSLMGAGAGILSGDEGRVLTDKLAQIDAFLRQQSITNQNNQANDSMGMTMAQFIALLNRQSVLDALGK